MTRVFRSHHSQLRQKPGKTGASRYPDIFFDKLTNFYPLFWGTLLSSTNCRISHTRQHLHTNGRTVIKSCTNPKVVAVQFAKWRYDTYAVELQPSDGVPQLCIVVLIIYIVLQRTAGRCPQDNDCSYTICTVMVPLNATVAPSAEWWGVQNSDTFRHKVFETERSVTSNTVTL